MVNIDVLSLLLILVCKIYPNESLTLESSVTGTWTEDSIVILKCKVTTTYSGNMTWKYSDTEVAKCTPSICLQSGPGDGTFSFAYDLDNYMFYWTISPVQMSHHNNVFKCLHGIAQEKYLTAVVDAKPAVSSLNQKDDRITAALGIAITSLGLHVLLWIVCFAKHKCCTAEENPAKKNKKADVTRPPPLNI